MAILDVVTRWGRLSAVLLIILLWIGTILLIIDTRRNYTHRIVKDTACPCESQPSSNSADRKIVSNSSRPDSEKPRTVVKWLRYCRQEKSEDPNDKKNSVHRMHKPPGHGDSSLQQQQPANGSPPKPPAKPKPPLNKIINPHPYVFTIKNSETCKKFTNADGYVDALCLVPTAPGDSYMRSLIRKTWGSAKVVKGKRIVTMFLLGQRDLETQHLLELENNHFQDIIQENFWDSYYNLTLKTLMGLKWAAQVCPNARYILKVDIDYFVNVYNLVDRLDSAPTFGLAEGNRKDVTEPIRERQSKWYTSKTVYPNDTYPPYLEGSSYLVSGDMTAKIVGNSLRTTFLPWEDAYVGIIMNKIGVNPKHNGRYSNHLDYSNLQETLGKVSESITFHLGEDKDENKENIEMVWNYVRQLNGVPVLD